MSSNTEQIKERLDIASVVSAYIKLEKVGANFKARCPFHSERTPSFIVSASRNTYHCFGCGRGGDIFSFVQEIEGVDFREALVSLADKAGVRLADSNSRERTERTELFDALAYAALFYETTLRTRPDVLDYLKERGVSEGAIKKFSIGYAPNRWESLLQALSVRGLSDAVLEKAGLVIRGDRGLYDRFRGRIMFPIRNPSGKVIGFSGRVFDERNRDDVAKYMNTPTTALYDKSTALYGYDTAKTDIRKRDACVIVEGQMDVVLAQEAGVPHTVAASGTALSVGHLESIRRLTNRVIFAFDSDDAGLSATERSATLALALGMEICAVPFPEGSDPADLAKDNPEAFRAAIVAAEPLINFYLAMIFQRENGAPARQRAIEQRVLPAIAGTANRIDRARYVRQVADALNVPEDAVWEEVRKRERPAVASENGSGQRKQKITSARKTHMEAVLERLFGILFWQESVKEPAIDTKAVRSAYEKIVGMERAEEIEVLFPDAKKSALAARAEISASVKETIALEVKELLRTLEVEMIQEHINELHIRIKNIDTGDSTKEAEHLAELLRLQKKREELISTE
ncbi:MAG: DNA primase [Candidatus Lloydbacteria bacterium CG22_combo_CG10-13_8_21_14_all_47_15]|uniref:DNA primase n=1 Tax=Candidatus Lloydbacteria bacterium CG22_combo_CG10-13_8_21_14_all_47_15 TaxID=1974635 RepID=A0A2H0CTD5_9BACT|nr:MAG: DNA primase [Candidatus Lloydbacteria bacterium CG22_combo_CG10-13_8_21_14_all_47_15]